MTSLFPDHYDCPGGCNGTGWIPEPDASGWCYACPHCQPQAHERGEVMYDPEIAPIPY